VVIGTPLIQGPTCDLESYPDVIRRLGGNSGSARDSTLTPGSIQKIVTIISKTGKITGEENNQEFFFRKILKLRCRALWSVEAIQDGTLIPATRGTAVR
jgi:hypothetical protein